uniref:Uncharacterized protein n=1 Tax=Physcomitrium patens TaxID=3218 RepID=A0A2K1IRR6_PHYPA|nr:hypothetical protein PHYPA_026094 [Physcomitrium patens]
MLVQCTGLWRLQWICPCGLGHRLPFPEVDDVLWEIGCRWVRHCWMFQLFFKSLQLTKSKFYHMVQGEQNSKEEERGRIPKQC